MKTVRALACAVILGTGGFAWGRSATFLDGLITGGGFPGPSSADVGAVVDGGGSGGGSTGGGLGKSTLTASILNDASGTFLKFTGSANHVSDTDGYTAAGTGTYLVDEDPFTTTGKPLVFSLDEPAAFSVSPGLAGVVEFTDGTGHMTGSLLTGGTLDAGTYLIGLDLRAVPGTLVVEMDWTMTLTAVPSPAPAAAILLGGLMAGLRRRR